MAKRSGLPVFWQIAHDVRRFSLSSHKEATTTMVVEAPSAKKPVRPPARPAGLNVVAAMGRHARRRSPRPPYRCVRRRLGSNQLAGHLPRRRVPGTRPDLMLKIVLYETLEGHLSPANGLAMCETAIPCDGSVRASSPAGRPCTRFGTGCTASLRDPRPGDPSRHGGRTHHGRETPSRTALRFAPVRRGITCSTRRPWRSDSRHWSPPWPRMRPVNRSIATPMDGSDSRAAGRNNSNDTKRRAPSSPAESENENVPRTSGCAVAGPNQRHRSGGPPGPRQGEGVLDRCIRPNSSSIPHRC